MSLHPEIRPYRSSTDEALVHKCWKDSFWANSFLRWAAKRDYYKELNDRCRWLVSSDSVLIAHNPADENHVWGFTCHSEGVLHYVWVRNEYRKRGIASGLVNLALGDRKTTPCSHWTSVCEAVQDRFNLRYVPSKGRRSNAIS